jgi:hypothetical protein
LKYAEPLLARAPLAGTVNMARPLKDCARDDPRLLAAAIPVDGEDDVVRGEFEVAVGYELATRGARSLGHAASLQTAFSRRTTTGVESWRSCETDKGTAVEQKAHSADKRPISHCDRPQPGQWLTSPSTYLGIGIAAFLFLHGS